MLLLLLFLSSLSFRSCRWSLSFYDYFFLSVILASFLLAVKSLQIIIDCVFCYLSQVYQVFNIIKINWIYWYNHLIFSITYLGIIVSFLYSNFPTLNNIFYLVNKFFRTNFIDIVPELYTLCYFLCNEVVVLKFSYKTINIA